MHTQTQYVSSSTSVYTNRTIKQAKGVRLGKIKLKRSVHFLADFIFLNGSFLLMTYMEHQSLDVFRYHKLLLLINSIWFIVTVFTGRLKVSRYTCKTSLIAYLGKSALFMMFATTLFAVLAGFHGFSRYHVIGSYISLFVLEVMAIFTLRSHLARDLIREINKPQIQPVSYRLVMADYALLVGSFLSVHFFKTGNGIPSSDEVLILVIITGFWLLASTWTKKFDKDQHYQNIYYAYSAFFKGGILIAAMLSVLIYSFQLFEYSRLMVFGPVAVLLILEIPLSYILYLTQGNGNGRDIESVNQVYSVLSQEQLIVPRNGHVKLQTPVHKKLEMLYLTENPDLYDFVSRHIDLEKTEASATRVFSTHTLFNVQVLDSNSLQLFINLHQVNDFRRINAYFLEVHQKLITEGYFVGKKSTIESRKERIYQKYPKYMAKVIYLIDFVCTRVAPKLPWTDKIYFALTNGRERVISKAELLGRLHFCGFKVIALEKIDENLYFIAQKAQMPSLDQNPSYGPFIKLERIGYGGKIIRVNKLRTMYPYSEYIQDFVFDQNNLDEKGKLKDDFRVTEWGRVFRKLWLDELPQVVNFIRGDLGLVGVRALSRHYFGLYPKEVQQLRIQTKPGLLPPYYADMPKSFDEIVESERRYLIEKQKHPLSTDFKYFFKAVYNIVFKKARSM